MTTKNDHPFWSAGLPSAEYIDQWAQQGERAGAYSRHYEDMLLRKLAAEQIDQDMTELERTEDWFEQSEVYLDASETKAAEPLFLPVAGGKPLIVPGSSVLVFGHRNAGKTWLAALAGAGFVGDGRRVTWMDFENQKADNTEKLDMLLGGRLFHPLYDDDEALRMAALNAGPRPADDSAELPYWLAEHKRLYQGFTSPHQTEVQYLQPKTAPGPDDLPNIDGDLVVIDAFRSLEQVLTGSSGDTSGRGVEQCYEEIIKPLAMERRPEHDEDGGWQGGTVIVIDHRQKSGDSALGSERKESMADLVLRVESVRPFSRDQAGYSAVTCVRDRKGHYAEGERVGYINVDSDGVRLEYDPLVSKGKTNGKVTGKLSAEERAAEIIAEVTAKPRFYTVSALACHLSGAFGMNEKTWRRDTDTALAEAGTLEKDQNDRLYPTTEGSES